jgi:hypothetical protein
MSPTFDDARLVQNRQLYSSLPSHGGPWAIEPISGKRVTISFPLEPALYKRLVSSTYGPASRQVLHGFPLFLAAVQAEEKSSANAAVMAGKQGTKSVTVKMRRGQWRALTPEQKVRDWTGHWRTRVAI